MNNETTSLQPFLVAYSKADSNEDFVRLFDSLSVLPFEDFLRFIKRSSCYQYCATYRIKENGKPKTVKIIHPQYFWNSQLTLRWVRELFCSDNAEEFLFGFFSKTENYNGQLLKEIAHFNPLQLIRSIKLKKCFLEDELYSKLHFMKMVPDQQLNSFYEEITAIKKLDEDWLQEKAFYQSVLDQFPIEEILVHTVSYYEKFKRSSESHIGFRAHQVSIEVCLISVLSYILNERRTKGMKIESALNIPEIYSLISRELPPLNTTEGIIKQRYLGNESISDTKKLIREALEFYFSYLHGFLYQVDKYCVGMAEVVDIVNGEVLLQTNNEYQLFKRDDKKSSFVERYFAHVANESEKLREKNKTARDVNEKQENLAHSTYMQLFAFMKVDVIKHKDYEIKPQDLITFLWNFSQWIMPQGKTVIPVAEEVSKEGTYIKSATSTREIPESFKSLFPQGCIVAFDCEVLLKSSQEYFGWDENNCKAIIDYLTFDLSNSGMPFCLPEYPLIQIGRNYFWPSTFLRDRHWFNVLTGRFQKAIHKKQSEELEIYISELFISAGFSAKPSVKYKDEEVREIDCLAYKDGCLFLIELKTTYPSCKSSA